MKSKDSPDIKLALDRFANQKVRNLTGN